MKQSNGFTRFWPTVVTISAMLRSVGLLALAIRAIPLSTAYRGIHGVGAIPVRRDGVGRLRGRYVAGVDPRQTMDWMEGVVTTCAQNLNTHAAASLYEAFPAPEARRLVERFEWHYTPKHGSWLDLAESDLGALASQCLDHRIPDKKTITDEVAAWVRERNKNHAGAEWHFSTDDARIKLRSL